MTAQALSVMALWGAAMLYVIATIAHTVRLARVADAKGVARAQAKAEARMVAAGSVGKVFRDDAAPRDDAPSAAAAHPAGKARGIARATMVVGFAFHLVGVVARAVEAGHAPWSNMYEYIISGTLAAVAVYLVLQARRDITYVGAPVAGLAAFALGLALTALYAESSGLPPALQSFWLVIHVGVATGATGLLSVAFFITLLQLGRDFRDSGARGLSGRTWRFLDAVPGASTLEGLAFRLHAVGFVLWTLVVMTGAMWAEDSWGRYWGWDPKEVWSFVIWVVYAAYLHARTTQGWAGRRSAYLAIAGYVAVILNFTVVNLVFQGLHSYA